MENTNSDEPYRRPVEGGPSAEVAAFARRLRQLRESAGSPSYRHLAKVTRYSSSTLADATAGRRLPTEPVLVAFVRACGQDPKPWVADLEAAARAARLGKATAANDPAADDNRPTESGSAAEGGSGGRVGRLRSTGVLSALAVLVFAAGAAVGVAAWHQPASASVTPSAADPVFTAVPSPVPIEQASDGTSPVVAGCQPDARLVDKESVLSSGVQVGALELYYSPHCAAGWARIYMYPGEPTTMAQVTVRAADGRYTTYANLLVKQISIFTDDLMPGPGGCLSAAGQVLFPTGTRVNVSMPCESLGDD